MTQHLAARTLLGIVVSLCAGRVGSQLSDGCDGKVVHAVVIHPRLPLRGCRRSPQPIVKISTTVHGITRPRVVDAFLTLRPGDILPKPAGRRRSGFCAISRFSPRRASARSPTTGVTLYVSTVDEIALIFDGNVQGPVPVSRVRLGDGNLDEGLLAEADWRAGFMYRDHVGGQLTDYDLFVLPSVSRCKRRGMS